MSMKYQGIIITGTSGAGKSTIAQKLCEKYEIFQRVQAVTTRKSREDDELNIYNYLGENEFGKLDRENKLLIKAEYRGEKYGITVKTFEDVFNTNKIPVLVLTPESSKRLDDEGMEYRKFLIIFLDSPDEVLNNRLTQRREKVSNNVIGQRDKDREYKDQIWEKPNNYIYVIKNSDDVTPDEVAQLICDLWEYINVGGLLPKRLIELMIKCGMLLENADLSKIGGASYDLSLGDAYWQDGEKKILDERNSFIKLKPGDYVIVSSREIANFPKDIAGRFDLTVSLFCQGIILSNGPQVDPGFNGRLFCLLFNTSNGTITLKRGQHYTTLEFIKLLQPTIPYSGKYQGKTDIIDYLPKPAEPSAIVKLKKDVDNLKSAKWWERTLPLILSILAIVASIGLSVFLYLININK